MSCLKIIDTYHIYNYDVDTNPDDEINAPNFPGVLYDELAPDPFWTAREININFSLDHPYYDTFLIYSRYGSETNDILLDGTLVTSTIGPGESVHQSFSIALGTLASGAHIVTIRYAGGGAGGDNFIDALSLRSSVLASITATWQIGTFDGAVVPEAGSGEFERGTDFYDTYNYNVDTNLDDEVYAPNFPGYLGYSSNASSSGSAWTAREINIGFSLDQHRDDVVLAYSRYGSETNDVLFDGSWITSTVGPGEYNHQLFIMSLGALSSGTHTVTIRYESDGVGNGNHIDALGLCESRSDCTAPYFSQRDPDWINHPLRTSGVCSSNCDTIGKCGCTLTSAAMVFKYYGANLTPATLSDCMGIRACPFLWATGAICSENKAQWIDRYPFTWSHLEQELNQNKRPVILGMHRGVNTHWVVVLSGSGNSPASYTIHDPWPIHGAEMKLDVYSSRGWYFDSLSVYAGQPSCGSLTATATEQTLYPQQVVAAAIIETPVLTTALATGEVYDIVASSVVTGSALLYRMTAVTMTVQLTATSEVGDVTDMLVWTDSMTQTTWQPFSTFVYLPISEEIYARFRDTSDNISETVSDTLHPVASPPTAPFEIFLPLILKK